MYVQELRSSSMLFRYFWFNFIWSSYFKSIVEKVWLGYVYFGLVWIDSLDQPCLALFELCLSVEQPKQNKPNLTKAKQGWSKPSIQTKPKQTEPNQTFSTISSKLLASNKIKSKAPEKHARAAQLLYRPVLVMLK